MTTNVIDTGMHLPAFPTTYTGQGTLVGNPVQQGGVPHSVDGFFTSNGNATQINLGFAPLRIKIFNATDAIVWEWQYGMAAANAIKTTLGGSLAAVVDTSSQFTIATDNGQTPGNIDTLTLGATLCGTSKTILYSVQG